MAEVVTSLLVIFVFLLVSWAWRFFNSVWLKPKMMEKCLREQGLKGPSYKFLYGDSKAMAIIAKEAASKPMELSHRIVPRVMPFLQQLIQTYGKMSYTWFGPNPRVIVMDPEIVKEILSDKTGIIGKENANPLTNLLVEGLVFYEGEKWVKHKRIISPTFHVDKLKMMLPAFHACCSEMINNWQNLVTKESYELDVWYDLENFTADVISRTAFGSSYEEGRQIFQLQTEQAALYMQEIWSVNIPGCRFLPTKNKNKMIKNYKETCRRLRELIIKRENAMKAGGGNNNDLLGLLLESNSEETKAKGNSKNAGMSIDDIVEECKLFYFAGAETSSNLLVWTMIVLSMHQDWQDKAREEVLQVFGNRSPDYDGLNRLKIVTMILNEVLRLYPPVIYLIRTNHKKIKLGEVTFPAGVELQMPILLLHHDHDLWGEDADEFKPERFSEGVAKATNNKVIFMPFSWGPRICIGLNFAMIESKLAMAMILQNFSFELSPKYQHAPCNVATLRPEHGAPLILRRL